MHPLHLRGHRQGGRHRTLDILLIFTIAFIFRLDAVDGSVARKRNETSETKSLNREQVARALVFVKDAKLYRTHYPFNAPFASPHIYAKDKESENRKLAERFPEYRDFIADEKQVVEVSIEEL